MLQKFITLSFSSNCFCSSYSYSKFSLLLSDSGISLEGVKVLYSTGDNYFWHRCLELPRIKKYKLALLDVVDRLSAEMYLLGDVSERYCLRLLISNILFALSK